MGNYRNFKLTTYFVAQGTKNITRDELQKQIDWFSKYMRLDKVYLEPFRDHAFASEEQVKMCKEVFEANGIEVAGGITTCIPTPEGDEPKQRLFNTFCYNDEKMLDTLKRASALNGRCFDSFIIDDFYFTNCTCEKCRQGRDKYNEEHGIEDGSWQAYRTALMYEVSEKYMIAPAKAENPDVKITIKYPNWMESYQETGYDPLSQKEIFDNIYTGTETRDPRHQDQHLPRYLSYSLMTYMDKMAPGRNGGGWFDNFDCQVLDYYLEQAYLTAFSKPGELMMFCFQSLHDSLFAASLGFQLDKLDELLDGLGAPVGIPCYIPNASQGEDNIQDHLGMNGFPVVLTPFFPEDAPTILLTASSTYDEDIVNKLENYVANGGKAIVTNGFVFEALSMGLERLTSIRYRGRVVTVNEFMMEGRGHWTSVKGSDAVTVPVVEFRNNATWAALCKGLKNEESYTLLCEDTYGKGKMMTMVVPDCFSEIRELPKEVLGRLRKEFSVNGIWFEGDANVSLFPYDNDTFVVYNYVTSWANSCDIYVHIKDAKKLVPFVKRNWGPQEILPLYTEGDEAVFKIAANVGRFDGYKIEK